MNNNYPVSLTTKTNNNDTNYIVFSVNKKQYAINIQNVIEVINIPQIEIPSKAPKGITGIFNYNGMIIKTVDLCPFLGFETPDFTINDKLIITIIDDNCFAIHTSSIENITQLDFEYIQAIPFNMENSILKQVYKAEDKSINIIDTEVLNKLITDNHPAESEIDYEKLFPSDEKSKQILNLRVQNNKSVQEIFSFPVNLSSANQYILFTLDNNNYYLDLKYIKEFISIKRLNITKLPYTEDFIKGIINLKGDFLVVLDLKRFLNNDINTIKEGSKLIITEGKNFNIALLVDEIKFIKNLKNTQSMGIYGKTPPYISSEFMENDELYSIINIEKIINDERIYINI